MEDEIRISKLKTIIDGEKPEEHYDEIQETFSEICQNVESGKNYTSTEKSVLNKAAEFLFEPEMKELLTSSSIGLRQYLFVLASNYLTDLDAFLYEVSTNPDKLKEMKLPEIPVRKLITPYETRSKVVTILKGRRMSERLRKICKAYPSLSQLHATTWNVINQHLLNHPQSEANDSLLEDKKLILQLWSSKSELCQLIFDNHLPPELGDQLNRHNVTMLADLSYEKLQEFCRELTAHEKKNFEKLYQKETSFSSKWALKESSLKKNLREKITQTVAIIESTQNQPNTSETEIEKTQKLISDELGKIGIVFKWEKEFSHLNKISQALSRAKETLDVSINPFKSDEELLAEIGDGLALHCVSYGMNDNLICTLATEPLFRKPELCNITEEISGTSQKIEEEFFGKEQVTNSKKTILDAGFVSSYSEVKGQSSDFMGRSDSAESPQISPCTFTLISFNIYKIASFKIHQNQLRFSQNALKSLENVKDIDAAETFLDRYGSHFSCGRHHLGGILCHSVELTSQNKSSKAVLMALAKEQMSAMFTTIGYEALLQQGGCEKEIYPEIEENSQNKIKVHFKITTRGPTALQPEFFEKLLRANSRSWHVVDRDISSESLIPIWSLIAEQHPSFKPEAELIRSAWLRKTAHVKAEMVQIEHKKIENRENTSTIRELEDKIESQLHKLQDIDVEIVEEEVLLRLLQSFFQTLSSLENHFNTCKTSVAVNRSSLWVTYVSKQEKIQLLLKNLALHQLKHGKDKFQQVLRFLTSVIDVNKMQELKSAGYPLDDKICEMIEKLFIEANQENGATAHGKSTSSTFEIRLQKANIENVVSILREEIREHQDFDNGLGLQWKIQTILMTVLNKTTKENRIRNTLEDKLVKYYGWKNGSFGKDRIGSITNYGLLNLVEELDRMFQDSTEVDSVSEIKTEKTTQKLHLQCFQDQTPETQNVTPDLKTEALKSETIKEIKVQQVLTDPVVKLQIRNPTKLKKIEFTGSKRKPFSTLLIDRPFSDIRQREKMNSVVMLMNCLRYRMGLDFNLVDNSDDESDSINDERNISSTSLFDTLLHLIYEFDAAGKEEIFRLLLERRSAIPLFIPDTENHLTLLQEISKVLSSSQTINLGEDKSLGRVVIVSCRDTSESQTSQLLNDLFHIKSLHQTDFSNSNVTQCSVTAEIAFGCIPNEAQTSDGIQKQVEHFLVLHVTGDFESLWPFIKTFADYLLIEDVIKSNSAYEIAIAPDVDSSAFSASDKERITAVASNLNRIRTVVLWRQSVGAVKDRGSKNRLQCIDGPLNARFVKILKNSVLEALCPKDVTENYLITDPKRKSLLEMCFPKKNNRPVEGMIKRNFQLNFIDEKTLSHVRAHAFTLQQSFKKQGDLEENMWENRMNDKLKMKAEADINSEIKQRNSMATKVVKHTLLQNFLKFLKLGDPCQRVLVIRQFERAIASRNDKELEEQRKKIQQLFKQYGELSNQQTVNSSDNSSKEIKSKLENARMELNKSVMSIEHLWRELSHIYNSDTKTYREFPQLAAQHLLDGFPIELLDGDSNLVNLQWMEQVINQLCKHIDKKKQRVFVLSIMGVQSSGKSTILNTMFGIQMRTSVGMCTRGVNMQLIAVEGRPEYDYILILDTEGTRAPEYHGLEGSEKRDNKMATLSILLADATIIVNPGENDAAIKEILPIVLMAYQGSKLAEDNGGRLSNMMFFVYNRIDTTQKEKLGSIIQSLSTNLNEAFDTVQSKLTIPTNVQQKKDSPFRNFKLDASNSSESDVRILGNVKKNFEAPDDVPDPAYGEALAEFREHIHRRVTRPRGEHDNWKARSLDQFAKNLSLVWNCIGPADFTLHFASIVERLNYDQLEIEYKVCEYELSTAYQNSYNKVHKTMITKIGNDRREISTRSNTINNTETADSVSSFERSMQKEVETKEIELDDRVKSIVSQKGRGKWTFKYELRWKNSKENQSNHWKNLLKSSFNNLFHYDSQLENFKKDMRKKIRELFSSLKENSKQWKVAKKEEEFNKMYQEILDEAKSQEKLIDVEAEVKRVFSDSKQIHALPISSLDNSEIEGKCKTIINQLFEKGDFERHGNKHENQTNWINWKKFFFWKSDDHPIEPKDYEIAIFTCVKQIMVGKFCYDDSICDDVIKQTKDILDNITQRRTVQNSDLQRAFIYARTLTIIFLKHIQSEWNNNNSVYAKLNQESNKSAMRDYFMKASQGVESTELFICQMRSIMKNNLDEAFEKEMIYVTTNAVRNEKWLNNGKFMQNHIDLYLIELLDDDKLHQVLDLISKPQELYRIVLENLVATKVPNGEQEYEKFIGILKKQIQQAITLASTESGRAASFVELLRKKCIEILSSPFLGEKLLINCSGEYEDCDKEDSDVFMNNCQTALISTVDQAVRPSTTDQQHFTKSLSIKVVEYMKTQNDAVARPRCDASCPWCDAQCLDSANHDTKLQLHDTIHQPAGLTGTKNRVTLILVHKACSKTEDETTLLRGDKELGKFKDFETIFPGWKKPKWKENWPLREYIFATYQDDIVKRYQHWNVKPCPDIPEEYKRELSSIREHLEKEIENFQL